MMKETDTPKSSTITPCPECGHGKQGGHNGRRCIAVVGGTYPDYEYDECGCKFTAGENEQ